MSKISNCFKLIELLSTGRKYNTSEIASLLEVNPRMIRYYIEELEKAGIYISSVKGKYGGYYLNYDYIIPVRGITNDDIKTLDTIKDSKLDELKAKLKNLVQNKHGLFTKEEQEYYNILSACINNSNKVEIVYTSSKGSVRTRIIHPEALYNNRQIWYVTAYCEYKQAMRRFRLKSISKIKVLEETF